MEKNLQNRKKTRKVKDLRHRVIPTTEPMMLNQMEVMRKSLSLLRPDLDRVQDHLLNSAHRPLHCLPLPDPSCPPPSRLIPRNLVKGGAND